MHAARLRSGGQVKLHEGEQAERIARELEVMRMIGVSSHLPSLPALLCTFASPVALFCVLKVSSTCRVWRYAVATHMNVRRMECASSCDRDAASALVCPQSRIAADLAVVVEQQPFDAPTRKVRHLCDALFWDRARVG